MQVDEEKQVLSSGSNQAATVAAADDDEDTPPWQMVLFGLAGWGATAAFYHFIQAFESGTGSGGRVWWPVALLYNVAGKWPVVALGALGGLALVAIGIAGWLKQGKGDPTGG